MPLTLVETGKQLDLAKITESGQKVREETADSGIDDLLKSILTNGQVHAVSVLDNGDGTYQLINGHRRYTAGRKGKLPWLRANVYRVPDGADDDRELLIQQHLHAANLSESLAPLERARQFQLVMDDFDVDISNLPEIFKGETEETIRETLKLLAIDQDVLDLVKANPNRFSAQNLKVLADFASASTKGSWRMKPEEQRAAAQFLLKQEDKTVINDPRKFDAHLRSVVKKRRDEETQRKAQAKKTQADPVKALFKALEAVETSVKALRDLDMTPISEIDPGDKGAVIKRVYDTVGSLTAIADDRVAKLPVRRAAS